ncbi:MAG: recombination regulator RecX [Deferribacteraceae bacterium]|jgi:regulatory protein|nr:recombination regulator RecX [Deferribacteraceae bacterium]
MACFAYALKLLSRRDYFETELRERLQNNFSPEQIEQTAAELKRLNYIDDERLLDNFIRWQLKKGHGERYIRLALNRKGVDCSMEEIRRIASTDDKSLSALMQYAEKYYSRKSGVSQQSCFRYLAARGFLAEDILAVLNKLKRGD